MVWCDAILQHSYCDKTGTRLWHKACEGDMKRTSSSSVSVPSRVVPGLLVFPEVVAGPGIMKVQSGVLVKTFELSGMLPRAKILYS